jgi:hypothetical protein
MKTNSVLSGKILEGAALAKITMVEMFQKMKYSQENFIIQNVVNGERWTL